MAVSRVWYVIFYVAYLIVLATALTMTLQHIGVPYWVVTFLAIGMLIFAIGMVIKELVLTREILPNGQEVKSPTGGFWSFVYWIMAFIAYASLITAFVFFMIYSTIPWWVWFLIGLSILFSWMATLILTLSNDSYNGKIFSSIVTIISSILYITGIIMFVLYTPLTIDLWVLYSLALVLYIIASILEPLAHPNVVVLEPMCPVGSVPVSVSAFTTIQNGMTQNITSSGTTDFTRNAVTNSGVNVNPTGITQINPPTAQNFYQASTGYQPQPKNTQLVPANYQVASAPANYQVASSLSNYQVASTQLVPSGYQVPTTQLVPSSYQVPTTQLVPSTYQVPTTQLIPSNYTQLATTAQLGTNAVVTKNTAIPTQIVKTQTPPASNSVPKVCGLVGSGIPNQVVLP